MRFWKLTRSASISLACCGLLIPFDAFAQTVSERSEAKGTATVLSREGRQIHDIQLDKRQTFVGVVVDDGGVPIARRPVQLWQQNKLLRTIESDPQGRFRFASLRGGNYQVSVGEEVQMVRCWAAGSAPPQALRALTLTASQETVRGQGKRPICGVANPWLIAGLAVAAVAIPIALHNSRSDRQASE